MSLTSTDSSTITYRGHIGGRIEVETDGTITLKPSVGRKQRFAADRVRAVHVRQPKVLVHGEVQVTYIDSDGIVVTTNPGVIFRKGKAGAEITDAIGWLTELAAHNKQHEPDAAAIRAQANPAPVMLPLRDEVRDDLVLRLSHCAEYHYLDELGTVLAGEPSWRGTVTLRPENHKYDPDAVRISVGRICVGYLARETTWRFHDLGRSRLELPATITQKYGGRIEFRFGDEFPPTSEGQIRYLEDLEAKIERRGGTVPAGPARPMDYPTASARIDELKAIADALPPSRPKRKAADPDPLAQP